MRDLPAYLSLLNQQLLQVLDFGLAPQQVSLKLLPSLEGKRPGREQVTCRGDREVKNQAAHQTMPGHRESLGAGGSCCTHTHIKLLKGSEVHLQLHHRVRTKGSWEVMA